MPSVVGTSVVGRQILMPYAIISDGRMSLRINGQAPDTLRLFGRISVELDGGGTFYFQVFDRAIWVPGIFWSVDTRLLPGVYRAAVWWKVAGLSYQFFWV